MVLRVVGLIGGIVLSSASIGACHETIEVDSAANGSSSMTGSASSGGGGASPCPYTSCADGERAICGDNQKPGDFGYCYTSCGTCKFSQTGQPCSNGAGCSCTNTGDAACSNAHCVQLSGLPLGIYGVCVSKNCNPLEPKCPGGQACLYSPNGEFDCWIRTDPNNGQVLSWLGDGEDCAAGADAKTSAISYSCGPGLQCVPAGVPITYHCRKLCDASAASPCAAGKCLSLETAAPQTFQNSPPSVGICCTKSIMDGCM